MAGPEVNAENSLRDTIHQNNKVASDANSDQTQLPILSAPQPTASTLEPGVHLSDKSVSPPQTEQEPTQQRPPHEEDQYLNLIRLILANGEYRPDRTGTGTLSLFTPPTLRFSLSKPSPTSPTGYSTVLPLLTTKRVFTRAVILELLWFLSASTSNTSLSTQGVHIWDGNGSRAYLDSLGPPQSLRNDGDLGPVYGFQWRHFGAQYVDAKTDYTGQGVDQIAEIVRKLREKPYDRRIILSAWNVADLGGMALPPCHLLAQFYVSFEGVDVPRGEEAYRVWKERQTNGDRVSERGKGRLSCTLYQRSADTGLGVPFNIASYALLTHMLAHACDLVPGTFNMVLGDAHVYVDHIEALKEQMQREPREFPGLTIRRDDRGKGNVDGWKLEDFEVTGYKPHASVKMKMSV